AVRFRRCRDPFLKHVLHHLRDGFVRLAQRNSLVSHPRLEPVTQGVLADLENSRGEVVAIAGLAVAFRADVFYESLPASVLREDEVGDDLLGHLIGPDQADVVARTLPPPPHSDDPIRPRRGDAAEDWVLPLPLR